MTWEDVVGVLRGLLEVSEQREGRGDRAVVLWFRVVEEGEQGRGEIGNGHLRKRSVKVEDRSSVGKTREGS